MNWLNKLEQKYGSKAIPNITRIFIAANLIGSVLLLTKGDGRILKCLPADNEAPGKLHPV